MSIEKFRKQLLALDEKSGSELQSSGISLGSTQGNSDEQVTEVDFNLSDDLSEFKGDYYRDKEREQQLKASEDNHNMRGEFTNKIFYLVCAWLFCVVILLLLSGFDYYRFHLSDTVLITFITSTTISVLGLFVVVAKWLFK